MNSHQRRFYYRKISTSVKCYYCGNQYRPQPDNFFKAYCSNKYHDMDDKNQQEIARQNQKSSDEARYD